MYKSTAALLALSVGVIAVPEVLCGEPTELFLEFPGGGPFGPPMLDPPGIAGMVEYMVVPNVTGMLTNPNALLVELPGQPPVTISRTRFG